MFFCPKRGNICQIDQIGKGRETLLDGVYGSTVKNLTLTFSYPQPLPLPAFSLEHLDYCEVEKELHVPGCGTFLRTAALPFDFQLTC